jgi:hypothetical protein
MHYSHWKKSSVNLQALGGHSGADDASSLYLQMWMSLLDIVPL